MDELTDAQAKVLRFVAREIQENGAPPTFRAIAAQFGYKSTRAAQDHVAALVRKGHLEHRPGIARGLRLASPGAARPSSLNVPVLGQIAAGSPRDASQLPLGALPFPSDRSRAVGEPALFALRVTGDSMIDAGILDGDYVIARAQRSAGHGEIVVALLDGESTVKRLHRAAGKVLLVPENARLKPIPVAGKELQIQGKVIGVQRYY